MCEEYGYAYLVMPKAACTSVKNAIGEQYNRDARWVMRNPQLYRPSRQLLFHRNLWKWTIVRHPGARLVSCWKEVVDPPDRILEINRGLKRKQGMGFDEFVKAVAKECDWNANEHYAQQSYLIQYRGRRLVDAVYRLEDLETAWPKIQERTQLGELPHIRKSEHDQWQSYYDKRLREMVLRRFCGDFAEFEYEW